MAKLGQVNCCFNFDPNSEYLDLVEELNITLMNQTTKQLESFLEKHEEQRINIILTDIDYMTPAIAKDMIRVINKNTYLRLDWDFHNEADGAVRTILQEYQIPYYYHTVIDQWDSLNEITEAGVSDVFIGNSLGFEIKTIHQFAERNEIKIRVYPNIAQSIWNNAPDATKFFIRPEDLYEYSQYIDTFELYEHPLMKQWINADKLYEVYKLDRLWYGDLRAIILGLHIPIDNRLLDSHWCYSRMNCGKRCAKDDQCHICDRYIEMSEKLSEKEIQFDYLISKRFKK